MTKNHILIKSVVLVVVLTMSPFAKAGVDRVLVTYFDTLYKNQSPKCSLSESTKSQIISEVEAEKCLIRSTSEGQSYISGVQAPCTEASVKAKVDSRVNGLCANTAQQAEKDALAKYAANQQAAAKKQQQGGSAGGGGGLDQQALGDASNLLMTYAQMRKDKKAEKAEKEKSAQSNNSGSNSNSNSGSNNNNSNSDSSNNSTAPTASKTSGDSSGGGSAKTPELPKASYTYDGPDGTKVVAVQDDNGGYTVTQLDEKGKPMANTAVSTPAGELQNTVSDKFGADPKTGKLSQPETVKALENSPKEIKAAGAGAADGKTDTGTDPVLEKRHAASKQEDAALTEKLTAIQTKITTANGEIAPKSTMTCNESMGQIPECTAGTPQFVINCVQQTLNELKTEQEELKKDKIACSDSSAQAEKLCSMVRSEKAQQVQQVMSVGATILSKMTAASEACGTTSNLNKIAQGGMLAAQAGCSVMKFRCDASCASAEKTLTKMKTKIETAIQKCGASRLTTAQDAGPKVDMAFKEYATMLEQQLSPKSAVPAAIVQCKEHKLDMATMGLAALGFLSAAQDAQKCKEQLNSGTSGGTGTSTSGLAGPTMTTAEYCAQPQNAASITCKCTANPNAEGCVGSLMGSGVSLGKINTNGGASGFASAKQNGLGSLESSGKKSSGDSSEPPPGAGLSEAAREALGMNSGPAGGSPGVNGNFGSGTENSKTASKEDKEKPKYGFFSSLGSMLSGGKSANTAAKAAIRNYEQDQAIKRKVASEQLRAEITTASGKSNFDKISNRYRESASSFEK